MNIKKEDISKELISIVPPIKELIKVVMRNKMSEPLTILYAPTNVYLLALQEMLTDKCIKSYTYDESYPVITFKIESELSLYKLVVNHNTGATTIHLNLISEY